MGTTIRRATEADRFSLFKLAAAMHAETDFKSMGFSPSKAVDRLGAWIHSPEGLMLVAEDGAEPFGMLAATYRAPWFSDDLMVSEDLFYVRADKRGSRAGFMLMREFVAEAGRRSARHVRAGIATGDVGSGAQRLYEHFGFLLVGGSFSLYLEH